MRGRVAYLACLTCLQAALVACGGASPSTLSTAPGDGGAEGAATFGDGAVLGNTDDDGRRAEQGTAAPLRPTGPLPPMAPRWRTARRWERLRLLATAQPQPRAAFPSAMAAPPPRRSPARPARAPHCTLGQVCCGTAQSDTFTCSDTPCPTGDGNGVALACNTTADCAQGALCCVAIDGDGNVSSACTAAAHCPQKELCDPNAAASGCPANGTCHTSGQFGLGADFGTCN